MTIEIKVPAMGESVTEATVARWFKKEGESVARDEPLLELETDKVTVEVPAPAAGSVESISVQAGATVLLLDEPTAHVDEQDARNVRRMIEALRGSVTIVLASHDAAVVALAENVIHLGAPASPIRRQ